MEKECRITLGKNEKLLMNKEVDERIRRNPTEIRSNIEIMWIVNKKSRIPGLEDRVVRVDFDGSEVVYNGCTYAKATKHTAAFKHYCCKMDKSCGAYVGLAHSAEEGNIFAVLLNQNHKGHRIQSPVDYDIDTGRAFCLDHLANCCDILLTVLPNLDDEFKNGIEEAWIQKQNEIIKESAFKFNRNFSLHKSFEQKFEKLTGTHRAYSYLNSEAKVWMGCKTLTDYVHYLGKSVNNTNVRTKGERASFDRTCALRTKCGSYQIDSVQLASNISPELAEAIESLTMSLFIKNSQGQKQIVNKRIEKCDVAYLFEDEKSNLEVGAFLLCKGILSKKFVPIDLRPMTVGRAIDEEKLELYEEYRLAKINKELLKNAQTQVAELKTLLDDNEIPYAQAMNDQHEANDLDEFGPLAANHISSHLPAKQLPADYDIDTGRSVYLNHFANCCDILLTVLPNLDDEFKNGIEEAWIQKQNEIIKEAAFKFNRHFSLHKSFEQKFEKLTGTHRAYSYLNSEAKVWMGCKTLTDYVHYLGKSGNNVIMRARAERNSFDRICALRTKCGSYKFDSVQLASNISSELAEAIESLTISLFMKNSQGQKQIVNKQYAKCDVAYLFKDEKLNLEVGAFLLCKGILSKKFVPIDLRPMKVGGGLDEEKLELYEGYRLAKINKELLENAQKYIAELKTLLDDNEIPYVKETNDQNEANDLDEFGPPAAKRSRV